MATTINGYSTNGNAAINNQLLFGLGVLAGANSRRLPVLP
jgi:hypothetical protein